MRRRKRKSIHHGFCSLPDLSETPERSPWALLNAGKCVPMFTGSKVTSRNQQPDLVVKGEGEPP
jgi:hypothetical protein